MVAPLTANVSCMYVKQSVMLLPAMSLGDWFSVCRKGGTGFTAEFNKHCSQIVAALK